MGKDKDFKALLKVEGFEDCDLENLKDYQPDKILKKEKTLIFFESSSTSDRKIHIGEMIQFLTYIQANGKTDWEYIWVLFLCGESKNAPQEDYELQRLKFYYNNFLMSSILSSHIKGLYVAKQPSNEELSKLTIEKIQTMKSINCNE